MQNLIMQSNTPAAPGLFDMLLPMVLIFILFWFLLIRPQTKRMKEHQAMLSEIKRGDKVMTSGGLLGKVTKTSETELTIEVANGVKVQVRRGMVADVLNKTEPANDRAKK